MGVRVIFTQQHVAQAFYADGQVTSVHRGRCPDLSRRLWSLGLSGQRAGPTLTASRPPTEGKPGQILLADGVGVTQDGRALRQEGYVQKQLPDVLS